MAVGKNKRLGKKGKGAKKKLIDPFAKKEWYEIRAPASFSQRLAGRTPVNRTQGTRIASEAVKGRVFEVNLADLQKDEDQSARKIKLRAEDVNGSKILTNFYGYDMTTDRFRSLVRKWQTMIQTHIDVKTTDGYILRLFAVAFTKRRPNQLKKTSYAQSSQIRTIRRKMMDIMTKESSCELKDLVNKFIPQHIEKKIEKECHGIYPLQNVHVRKVKLLKSPKFDAAKLLEIHGEASAAPAEDTGKKV